MDGTLIDTNVANFLSYKKAIESVTKEKFELKFNSEERFNRSHLEKAVPDLGFDEYERIIREKEECYKDFVFETKLNKEIAKILWRYAKTNRTVLVTNCREDRVFTTMNHHGLTKEFDNIIFRQTTKNDNKINKFEKAISTLGVSPDLIIAFENEEIEIADARRAGIKIINPRIF